MPPPGFSSRHRGAGGSIRILVADDHPAVRAGLAAVLTPEPDLELVAEAANGREAVARSVEHRPDVVLMDLRMPVMDGITATRAIVTELPATRVLAFTTYDGDGEIRRALESGARGFLLKDMLLTEVIGAVREVYRGGRVIPAAVARRLVQHPERNLTEREVEVLELAARGLANRQIAAAIGCMPETVKLHLKHIFAKLDVGDRTAAVTSALGRGIIRLDRP